MTVSPRLVVSEVGLEVARRHLRQFVLACDMRFAPHASQQSSARWSRHLD
jgi:hypothetical protein